MCKVLGLGALPNHIYVKGVEPNRFLVGCFELASSCIERK